MTPARQARPRVHFVVPAGIDSPSRPSGGNVYDRRMSRRLGVLGWQVVEHPMPGGWPHPAPADYAALTGLLDGLADGSLVLIDGLIALCSPALAEQATRLRLVVLVHMLLTEGDSHGLGSAVEGSVLSSALGVITTSHWTKNQVVARYGLPPEHVSVVEPGADVAAVADGTASGGALLCVAAVTEAKGYDVLLHALVSISALDWTCRCAGALDLEKNFTENLRRQAVAGGIASRVQFLGALASTELAAEYASADVLVLASRGETYGMVVAEALARGIPVIATSVGGVPEALGTGSRAPGLLVPSNDPVALAAALRAWLGDAALRARLRSAARESRQTVGEWGSAAATFSEVLGRLATRAPARNRF
ncbi:glycosyltransferase family 4 protein [Arthrobacter glacialis]|uniref:glycosyltransferase family 4 protein n=1 Tax=Arthrobacter glacialis TaxID=1664 RepID=UPI001FAEF3EC|nr:glycosyltransferase family 4 protein [Arthrobacter glacialis]